MRRALVTGATGGLGRALVSALQAEGYAVRATGRDTAIGDALGVGFVPGDLRQPGLAATLAAGIDVVFHAAALSSPWGREADFQAINVEATSTLLEAARQAGCDGFVFISTPSVYAEPRDRLDLTETSPLPRRFANAYARTKFAAESLVRAAAAPGFSTIVLRPRALIGPHDKVLLPRLLRVARTGRFPLFRGGKALIDLTDIRDAAEAAIAADRNRGTANGQVFNISGGRPEAVREILGEVFGALGLGPRLIALPYGLAAGAARALENICALLPGRPEPPATSYTLSTLAFSQTFDLNAAHRVLDWQPRFSPQQAIQRTAEHWRRHAPL
jgi:nucleoside-diphosphate-sugar epimerase